MRNAEHTPGGIEIKKPYIQILHQGDVSFGGSQAWFSDRTLSGYGCGLIGAADVLIYLYRNQNIGEKCSRMHESNDQAETPCEEHVYQNYVGSLRREFFPVFPKVGISGWVLVLGLRRCFRRYHLPYTVRWGVRRVHMRTAVEEMLRADIPVLFSVGPNFPWLWGKHGVPLYTKGQGCKFIKSQDIRAHYMVATAMSGDKLKVSTWGREYYLDWNEYQEYIQKHSCSLYSNICYITNRQRVYNRRGTK